MAQSFCGAVFLGSMLCGLSVAAASPADMTAIKEHIKLAAPGSPRMSVKERVHHIISEKEQAEEIKAAPSKSDEATVKVRINFPPIGEEWIMYLNSIRVYNGSGFNEMLNVRDFVENGDIMTASHIDVNLPVGTYDLMGIFQKLNPDNIFTVDHMAFDILENVDISEGSEVTFNPEECTVRLSMQTYNPDGEKTRFRTIRYNEDWTHEILEESNVSSGIFHKMIFLNNELVDHVSGNVLALNIEPGPIEGEYNCQDDVDFFVTPVGDRYLFRDILMYGSWPDESIGTYIMVTEAQGGKEGVYSNSRDFVFENSQIVATPAAELYPPINESPENPATPYGLYVKIYCNDSMLPTGISSECQTNHNWNTYSSRPENPVNENEIYLGYMKSLNDAYIPLHEEWGDWVLASQTQGSDYFPFAKDGLTMNVSPWGFLDYNPDGISYPIAPFPGNKSFMSQCSNITLEAGASAPLFTYVGGLKKLNWETSEMEDWFQCWYTGRLNENIGSDLDLAKSALYVKGEKVAEGWNPIDEWIIANPNTEGDYRLEVSTDNYKVDGISGGNTAVISYAKCGDDMVPPTATMLQLRDGDKICQEFENGANSEIMISAADLTCEFTEPDEYGKYSIWLVPSAPARVSATVRPTGVETEAFEEIGLTERADAFDPRGFGALYAGSLSKISMVSPTGWYDLTITVEDAAGNSQTQTLSPAFKLSHPVSLGDIRSDDNGVRVSDRNIIAPAGSRVYTLSGLRCPTTRLTPGLYIVVTPDGTSKVTVR